MIWDIVFLLATLAMGFDGAKRYTGSARVGAIYSFLVLTSPYALAFIPLEGVQLQSQWVVTCGLWLLCRFGFWSAVVFGAVMSFWYLGQPSERLSDSIVGIFFENVARAGGPLDFVLRLPREILNAFHSAVIDGLGSISVVALYLLLGFGLVTHRKLVLFGIAYLVSGAGVLYFFSALGPQHSGVLAPVIFLGVALAVEEARRRSRGDLRFWVGVSICACLWVGFSASIFMNHSVRGL